MKNTLLAFLATTLCAAATAAPVIADWRFAEVAGSTLNQTVNEGSGLNGPGSTWGLALTGSATNGAGQLSIGNDGKGGSGTRSAYADFGPNFDSISTGTLSLYASIANWSSASPGSRFSLGFIEGNDFNTAAFSLSATAGGFNLGGGVDAFGDGSVLASTANLAAVSALTLRLDLDLDALMYSVAYDLGSGFTSLGSASVDSLTQGVNSLWLGVEGDFSSAPLLLDRIWVTPGKTVAAVPEPGSAWLVLSTLLLLAVMRRRAS
ncbi:hypothetical protein [Paucibacter sp. DJ2R-2]|uniref:hypothetical protein n=1 Tax=Paucibacter sp. DJ2R-2 TaxID=2893558 RepID=UPI0021E4EDAE|nr:hypothetical protein [Paucibacter sp. DJ2R-2]MCV2419718.1 hypothetical protein [Paucibacter sp. DJ4R-1]MCV2437379.1 hypothetical protein [Paucibacter sp. DJ2R-2]